MNIDYSQKMVLIGAGPVGLAMAKALLSNNIAYDQLEADDDVGGNWYHGVYETAHIISSKKTTEYADYPMPDDYPDFPSAAQMVAYLRDYADLPEARTGLHRFFTHYNQHRPHQGLKYQTPEQVILEGTQPARLSTQKEPFSFDSFSEIY